MAPVLLALAAQVALEPGHPVSVVSDQVPYYGPSGIAYDPAGGLFVCTGGEESSYKARVIRLALDGTWVLHGGVIRDPDGIAVGPDGAVYVGSRNGVYKITPGGITGLLAVDPQNFGETYPKSGVLWQADYLAWNPAADFLYASGPFGSILRIDPATGAYTTVTAATAGGLAFRGDGRLYCGTIDGPLPSFARIFEDGVIETIVDFTGLPYGPVIPVFHEPSCTWYASTRVGEIVKITPAGDLSIFATGFVSTWGLCFDAEGKTMFVADPLVDTVYRIDGFGMPGTTQPLGYTFPEAILGTSGIVFGGSSLAAGIAAGAPAVRPTSLVPPYSDGILVRSWTSLRAAGNANVWAHGQAAPGSPVQILGQAVVTGGVAEVAAGPALPVAAWEAPAPTGPWTASGVVSLQAGTHSFTSASLSNAHVTFQGDATVWIDGDFTASGAVTIQATGTLVLYVRGGVTLTGQVVLGRPEAPYETHVLAVPLPGSAPAMVMAGGAVVHGTIFAPGSDVAIEGGSLLHGPVVGRTVTVRGQATVLVPPGPGAGGGCD